VAPGGIKYCTKKQYLMYAGSPINAIRIIMPSLSPASAVRRPRFSAGFPAIVSSPPSLQGILPEPAARHLARLAAFIAADRDRWVALVCGGGFALLMWVDWLAA
jgi:hypothetical protein